ncbi:MAG: FAD-dependent monooxygenase [Miltoncostaeaceae bacterium]
MAAARSIQALPPIGDLPEQASVVIVGAGPVGSALAIELALHGVTPLVLDRRVEISHANVRARNISIRTLELARKWGVAQQFRDRQTLPDSWYRGMVIRTRVAGHDLCEPIYGDRPAWTPHAHWHELASERAQDLPQYHVNEILQERALALGVPFATGWEVEHVETGNDGATVTARHLASGAVRTVHADWVVGADGARSIVRDAAGIEMVETEPRGRIHNVVVRIDNAFERLGLEPAALMFVFNEEVAGMVSPIDGDHWRLGVGPVPMDHDITEDEILEVVEQHLGRDVQPQVLSYAAYVAQKRVVATRRAGRLLLAGDAAHGYPPHLGQLLNSGVADAQMLGWTLAAIIHGWGGDALLDAYDDERTAVSHRLSDATIAMLDATVEVEQLIRSYGNLEGDDPGTVAKRAELGAIISQVMGSGSDGLIFDDRHPESPIVVQDGSEPVAEDPSRYIASARPGHHAPHVWLGDDDALSDHFGNWFTLLDTGASADQLSGVSSALAAAGVPFTHLRVDDDAVRRAYESPLTLIRPDRVVAWRAGALGTEPSVLADAVRGERVRVLSGAAA